MIQQNELTLLEAMLVDADLLKPWYSQWWVWTGAGVIVAGAVTAALFLKRFIDDVPWVHFDVMAFNIRKRPGRPEGGEAMALRSVYRYLAQRFGTTDE